MTWREAIAAATQRLAIDQQLAKAAARDAELLLLHLLATSRATLFAHPDCELSQADQLRYEAIIARRLTHEPIQYITGEQEFYGLTLHITPAVLIPRPETEHLVEAVLERLPEDQPLRILDVGTGSGAIAIALAIHLPQAHLTAVDVSFAALAIAQQNAQQHGLCDRIRFLESDLLSSVPTEKFDAIVSNPPYIPESDRPTLHPQVREHEPAQALFAANDGFAIYERLIPEAHVALKAGGLLALEIGFSQRDRIANLLQNWQALSFVEDLQGIPRVALASRSILS